MNWKTFVVVLAGCQPLEVVAASRAEAVDAAFRLLYTEQARALGAKLWNCTAGVRAGIMPSARFDIETAQVWLLRPCRIGATWQRVV